MQSIRQLAPGVVNKIAAGEVIERPASVVKELLENSIDAGSRRIEISVDRGGCDRVRVSDDGCGIEPEQLILAVDSHATSKIESADDLFSVRTLGFRGEALASIAEVSRLRIRSRVAGRADGARLEVEGGQRSSVVPTAADVGTTVEVEDQFFNTPVRRKFLKAVQTEFAHVAEAFARVALPYLDRAMTLHHNGRLVHELHPVTDWRERIVSLFGRELADGLIWIDNQERDVRLSGYVADPAHSRGHNKMQYLFLNGRYIRDRSLQHALGESYRGLLMQGRHPIAFLRLEMPPQAVDVNVHPCKLEVRFQDGGQLYSQLLGTLRSRFLSADLRARVQAAQSSATDRAGQRPGPGPGPDPDPSATTSPPPNARPLTGSMSSSLISSMSTLPSPEAIGQRFSDATVDTDDGGRALDEVATARAPVSNDRATVGHEADAESNPSDLAQASRSAGASERTGGGQRPWALQAHNRYLVTEGPGGLEVIDQHALHERILYEELRARILGGVLERQRLLVPDMVQLVPTEAAAVLEQRGLLAELGLEVEDFGGGTVAVSSYPAMLRRVHPAELLRQVAHQLVAEGKHPDRRDLLDHLLATMACKAAVKAGDHLTHEEINALVLRRHDVQDSHHCPHGRPTTLVFSCEELDRRFKRV